MNLEYGWVLQGGLQTKTDKNTASVFRVFDLLYIQLKPYESELSTALYECKAVARCATRKTDTAINRIKTGGTCKLRIENTSGRKQNKTSQTHKLRIENTSSRKQNKKTVGPEKLYSHLENRCGKQRKTVGACKTVLSLGKHK